LSRKRCCNVERPHKKAKKVVNQMAIRHLIDDFNDENFVFRRGNGFPFAPKNILIRMIRLLEKTSIKKHATPHIFRHTHVSMLTEAGVDITEIMERVGHDDMKTTLKIYTHVTKKMKKETSEKVHRTYGSLLNLKISK
jgi:site-specific recombinase XerD